MNLPSSFARTGKRIAIAATFGALCFFVGAPRAQAEDRNNCQVRVERAESKLRDAIQDHGYYSRQANERQHDLNREQQRCWNQTHFWNGYRNQWHSERDWDRGERNTDRDRDRGQDNGNHYRDHGYDRDSH